MSDGEKDREPYRGNGIPWGQRLIRHPSHADTRAHFLTHPLPQQKVATR